MIHEHSHLQEIIDFARMEPESTEDLIELMREASIDSVRKAMDLGANLLGAGARIIREQKTI